MLSVDCTVLTSEMLKKLIEVGQHLSPVSVELSGRESFLAGGTVNRRR